MLFKFKEKMMVVCCGELRRKLKIRFKERIFKIKIIAKCKESKIKFKITNKIKFKERRSILRSKRVNKRSERKSKFEIKF